jgi:nucleotide-binding universal stress UspA family protein
MKFLVPLDGSPASLRAVKLAIKFAMEREQASIVLLNVQNLAMQMRVARAGLRVLELPVPYRCRVGGESKVAGSLKGSLVAGYRIVVTFARVALQRTARRECNLTSKIESRSGTDAQR